MNRKTSGILAVWCIVGALLSFALLMDSIFAAELRTLDITIGSAHISRDEDLNEHNPGLGLTFDLGPVMASGGYISANSYGRPSVYLAALRPLSAHHYGRFFFVAGVANGYGATEVDIGGGVAPLLGIMYETPTQHFIGRFGISLGVGWYGLGVKP